MPIRPITITLIGAIVMLLAVAPGFAKNNIAISAGAKIGPFYRLGQLICKVLNRKTDDINCTAVPMRAGDAPTSFANIINVRDGAAEIGIVRSDWQHFAFTGTGPVRFIHSKFDTIRSLFSIDIRPFTLIAKRNLGINDLEDLKGQRVNLGPLRSDSRNGLELVMVAKNWTSKDFELAEELPIAEQSLAFCHDRVHAMAYVVSHPNQDVRRLTKQCEGKIIDIAGPDIDKLVKKTPYLSAMTIPAGTYASIDRQVHTFGTTITVVSSADVSQDLINSVVKAVFDNLDTLKAAHPVLRHMNSVQMLKGGLSAPLHDGARQYFVERGLF